MSSEWPEPDSDEVEGFGPCDHDFRCWRCGEIAVVQQGRSLAHAVGQWTALFVMLLLVAIVLTPLVWAVRVCWSWAL